MCFIQLGSPPLASKAFDSWSSLSRNERDPARVVDPARVASSFAFNLRPVIFAFDDDDRALIGDTQRLNLDSSDPLEKDVMNSFAASLAGKCIREENRGFKRREVLREEKGL